jgi:hypothetical protein
VASQHRAALSTYLASTDGEGLEPRAPLAGTAATTGRAADHSTVTTLRAAYTAINDAAIRYAELTTMAFRLYEPPLRELAPKHLRDYAEAAQQINQLIAPAVAAELRGQGLECQCVCPMCTLGACGCVAISTRNVNAAWRETAPPADSPPGLLLQPPRPDCEVARAGLRGGEQLLAIDDRPIGVFTEVQAAIREHPAGEDLRFRVQRGAAEPEEVHVRPAAGTPAP